MDNRSSNTFEDDYIDLHIEGSTYGDFDWDKVPADLVNGHDDILTMNHEGLAQWYTAGADPLHLWAAARRWLELEERERFLTLTRTVIEADDESRSPWLSYPDIQLELARVLAATDLPGALALYDGYATLPDHSPTEVARYRGLSQIAFGDEALGIEELVSAVRDHGQSEPELALFYAENLVDAGARTAAIAVIEAGIAVAGDDADLCRELDTLRSLT